MLVFNISVKWRCANEIFLDTKFYFSSYYAGAAKSYGCTHSIFMFP